MFIFVGMAPCADWLGDLARRDEHGFVITGTADEAATDVTQQPPWQPSGLETSHPGLFAVGDVRSGSIKRVAAAVGEGAMVIRMAFERMKPA
jgi:thioredoxin reductase (NADPH)